MKRILMVSGAFLVCTLVVGCSKDTHEGLLSETINMMGQAATEIGVIKKEVQVAAQKVKDGTASKLDFTAAIKACDKLKDTGDKTQEIKRRISLVQSSITDEERQTYATNQKPKLTAAFAELNKADNELKMELKAAESIPGVSKTAVDDMRKKIVDALSPFEAQARQ